MLKGKTAPITQQECTNRLAGVTDALYVIGGKWKLPVIIALNEGHKRFNELQRAVKGISARVLSGELKDMELNGFIKRTVHTHSVVIIEYELTEYSSTLGNILNALSEWGTMHKEKIRKER